MLPVAGPILYLALCGAMVGALRHGDRRWWQIPGLALAGAALGWLVPSGSPLLALLLVVAFLVASLQLAAWSIDRWVPADASFAVRFSLMCILSLAALVVAAAPLLVIAMV